MAYGVIGYSQPNSTTINGSTLISGSIWGDCQADELRDEGTGLFTFQQWDTTSTISLPNAVPTGTSIVMNSTLDRSLNLVAGTAGTTSDVAIWTRPYVNLVPNGGLPFWFETSLAMNALAAVGLFVGLVSKNGLGSTLQITDASTIDTSTSFVGFWMHAGSSTDFDAVVSKGIPSAASATSTIQANVLTANSSNPNPGNPSFVPPSTHGALVAAVPVKLGLRFDGLHTMYWYVDGNQVAKAPVDSSGFNITSTMGATVNLFAASSTAGGYTLIDNWFRVAAKVV